MRTGLIVSVIGHLAILLWGLVSLSSSRAFEPVVEALPVDFVEVDEVTNSPKGMTTASLSDKPSPSDPAEKAETEKPPPMPPKPQAKPTPPPPPPPAPAAAKPDEPAPKAEAEPQPDPIEAKLAEPKPEATPEPPPEPEVAAAASPPKPVPVPKVRPKHQPPPAPPTPAEPADEFDPDRIAALLDKETPSSVPEESTAPSSLGVPFDSASLKMTQNELDRLRSQVQSCWVIPVGWTDPRQVTVTIRFALNVDGTVAGVPEVMEFPASQYGQVSADNAIRAVLQCGPYQLPPEKYDQWREVQLRFTPQG